MMCMLDYHYFNLSVNRLYLSLKWIIKGKIFYERVFGRSLANAASPCTVVFRTIS